MAGVSQDAFQSREEWNYVAVEVSLFGGLVLQMIVLPCLCYAGTVRMYIAIAVDLLVILRLVIARILRERNRGWIFYAMLPYLIIPIIFLVEHFWGPH